MFTALFWLYIINATLLINHEIDSAYWKEWELFKLPDGINGFLLIHFPQIETIPQILVLFHQWGCFYLREKFLYQSYLNKLNSNFQTRSKANARKTTH